MRKPEKPGTQDSKTQTGGALGNIDEQTGHPGKGTSGATMRPQDNPDPSPDPSKGPKPERPGDADKPA